HLGRVVPPNGFFPKAIPQVVVRKQTAVLEVFARIGGGVKHATELVELFQAVPAGPGEPSQRAQIEPSGMAAADADGLRYYLDAFEGYWPLAHPLPFVEEHELQGVEVGSQDQNVIDVALAQDTDQVVADLGRERLWLGEDDPQKLFGVF